MRNSTRAQKASGGETDIPAWLTGDILLCAGAISQRSATGLAGRLRCSGEGGELVVEGFVRRAVAEAAPRRCMEHRGHALQLVLGELGQVAVAGQKAADAAVRVLHRTLLPGAVRIAEEGLGAGGSREDGLGGELGATIEGDGPAASFRQPLPGLADPSDRSVGPAIRVGQ